MFCLSPLRLLFAALLLLAPRMARAHVGSPDVFFDGQVGPYPAHIVDPHAAGRARPGADRGAPANE